MFALSVLAFSFCLAACFWPCLFPDPAVTSRKTWLPVVSDHEIACTSVALPGSKALFYFKLRVALWPHTDPWHTRTLLKHFHTHYWCALTYTLLKCWVLTYCVLLKHTHTLMKCSRKQYWNTLPHSIEMLSYTLLKIQCKRKVAQQRKCSPIFCFTT